MEIFQLTFENDKVIVEADAERDQNGLVQFFNILVTDKVSGRTYETLDLPDNLIAVAKSVSAATPEDE